jgi:outer membrane lipoprotein-sorting protein
MKYAPIILLVILAVFQAQGEDDLTAKVLAAKLNAIQHDGSSLVRLKMTTTTTLQLQIKQRRTASSAEVVYQILWPKERAGEAVLLRQPGNQASSGTLFVPPATFTPLDMKMALFGSALTYVDVLENFFAWPNQVIAGTEIMNRVSCQILESKPGQGQRSMYASIRTWVDSKRFVPLRIEKYNASGQLLRRIDSGRIVTDDMGRKVPAGLTISDPINGRSTELEGSKLTHGMSFTDAEFTSDGLKQQTTPRSSSN